MRVTKYTATCDANTIDGFNYFGLVWPPFCLSDALLYVSHTITEITVFSIYGSNICVNKTEIDIKEKGIDYSGGS